MLEKQKTVSAPVSVIGKGLHTSAEVELKFLPAPENHGVKFKRVDLADKPVIEALIENVIDTSRGTTIGKDGNRIMTIEHVMSAVYGLGIDNLLIEINAPETPIMDGSSRFFTEALEKTGFTEQHAEKDYYDIHSTIIYKGENDIEIIALPDNKYSVSVMVDYNSEVLASQNATLSSLKDYKDQISKCRTFVFLHELEALLKNNLIKGGDLTNAIVLIDKEVNQIELDRLADVFNKPHVEVKAQGVLNNLDLHFQNEPARHKLLDLIGDLALIGVPIRGRIIATKPGHAANVEFARMLKKIIKKERSKNAAPSYDLNKEPLMDINQIMRLLPHRYPFLLVDKIIEMTETSVVGVKNVTMNEAFFVGHFPEEPVMPGVLQIEALAQVGGILALHSIPDPENYTTLFMKIDNVKFKKKIVPGDTIIFKLELVSPIRRGIALMRGKAYSGGTLAMEGEMMAQIEKKKK